MATATAAVAARSVPRLLLLLRRRRWWSSAANNHHHHRHRNNFFCATAAASSTIADAAALDERATSSSRLRFCSSTAAETGQPPPSSSPSSVSSPSSSPPPSPATLHLRQRRPQMQMQLQDFDLSAPDCNVPPSIAAKVGQNLHQRPGHPLHLIQQKIVDYYNNESNQSNSNNQNSNNNKEGEENDNSNNNDNNKPFQVFTDLSPIVSTVDNFDLLRIPPDHTSRQLSDTYYLNPNTVLRTHTSAHQVDLLRRGHDRFLVSGDVYRRDAIDHSHYPVFHQMEGVKIIKNNNSSITGGGDLTKEQQLSAIEQDLKRSLEGLAHHLFGNVPMRWVDEYFPFTHPSYELEIFYQDEWMEVLGCGVVHPEILRNAGRRPEETGWAFGLGLERLAMVLYHIPDIRLFWTDDDRFHRQFASAAAAAGDDDVDANANNVTFQPYSKYPPCFKDVSFWINNDGGGGDNTAAAAAPFHVNDLNEVVRDVAGDLVEQVELVDRFTHPQTDRTSHCYRIAYRSMDRSLRNDEIDALQERIRSRLVQQLNVELR